MEHSVGSNLEQQLMGIKEQGYEHFRLEYWRDWDEGRGVWQLMIWCGTQWNEFKATSPIEAVTKASLWIGEK